MRGTLLYKFTIHYTHRGRNKTPINNRAIQAESRVEGNKKLLFRGTFVGVAQFT
jgi:hypothetical protein